MNREKLSILLSQIRSLRDEVDKVRPEDADRPGRPGSGISAFIPPFNSYLARARELFSDDSSALQSIEHLQPLESFKEGMAISLIHKQVKSQIRIATGELLAVLESYLSSSVTVPSMNLVREGVFFAGQYYDALAKANAILKSAQKSIDLIDGYLNEDVLNLLTAKKPGVTVRILTKTTSSAFETTANAFNKQYGGLSMRTSNVFHDRFVIIDYIDFYHFGASIKDLGTRGFMFSRIEEPSVIELIRKNFEDEWKSAKLTV